MRIHGREAGERVFTSILIMQGCTWACGYRAPDPTIGGGTHHPLFGIVIIYNTSQKYRRIFLNPKIAGTDEKQEVST